MKVANNFVESSQLPGERDAATEGLGLASEYSTITPNQSIPTNRLPPVLSAHRSELVDEGLLRPPAARNVEELDEVLDIITPAAAAAAAEAAGRRPIRYSSR